MFLKITLLFLKLIIPLATRSLQQVARKMLHVARESTNRWDDRLARRVYDAAGTYRLIYEEINSESLIHQPPDNPEPLTSQPPNNQT